MHSSSSMNSHSPPQETASCGETPENGTKTDDYRGEERRERAIIENIHAWHKRYRYTDCQLWNSYVSQLCAEYPCNEAWCALFEKWANKGHVFAMFMAGEFLIRKDTRDDWHMAQEWYQRAASRGCLNGQYRMGHILCRSGNVRRGLHLLEKAAKGGHLNASWRLYSLYKDMGDAKAVDYFWEAHRGGHWEAKAMAETADLLMQLKDGETKAETRAGGKRKRSSMMR